MDAFEEPYKGDPSVADLLISYVNKCFPGRVDSEVSGVPDGQHPHEYYANVVPILQSSGSGKSRTLAEVSKKVITFQMNLGPNSEAFGVYITLLKNAH
jgi:hypothetical protein